MTGGNPDQMLVSSSTSRYFMLTFSETEERQRWTGHVVYDHVERLKMVEQRGGLLIHRRGIYDLQVRYNIWLVDFRNYDYLFWVKSLVIKIEPMFQLQDKSKKIHGYLILSLKYIFRLSYWRTHVSEA